jgi:hypothetical protein
MPARPAPLTTTNHSMIPSKAPFSPLPSELPRTPIHGHFDTLKSHDEILKTPITPPAAYTDFLKNTINSPAVSSPRPPQSPAHPTSASYRTHFGYYTPTTPYPLPTSARRLRIPKSSSSANSPSTESPGSSRSPSEDEVEAEINRGSNGHRQVTVKQVVTTTVTYTPTRMNLLPAPKGKRRRLE